MVDELLVKFKDILSLVEKDSGKLSLFALVKMDDLTSSWTIIVSKPNLVNMEDRRKLFKTIVQLMVRKLDENELTNIARLGVFTADEHLVSDMLRYKEGHIEKTFPANGNLIHEAYILRSNG